MSCKSGSGRKGPRRAPPKEKIDDELSELAAVIAEYQLDNNANGWFKLPWRNGWNAVELGLHAAAHENVPIESSIDFFEICAQRRVDPEVYWAAEELLTSSNQTFRAALRCLQILNAKSDGGGEVYNAILIRPFSKLLPERIDQLVLEYRCLDSIGVTPELKGDVNDRLRRAFVIAWKRGLYAAAYSLPAAVIRIGPTVVKGKP